MVKKNKVESDDLISIIILSDSPGYRMKSYGPTPLISLNNKFLIDLQISTIKKTFKKYEIILCVGFDAEKIIKHVVQNHKKTNIRIVENQFYNTCNSCEGLRLSLNNTLNNKIVIMDGGLLFGKKTLSTIDRNCDCAIVEKSPIENLEIGININLQNIAQHFSFGAYKTWSEIIYIQDSTIIENVRKFLQHQDSKKKFIFEAFNEIIKQKYEIKCIENKQQLFKINNIKTYHHIKDNYEIFNL